MRVGAEPAPERQRLDRGRTRSRAGPAGPRSGAGACGPSARRWRASACTRTCVMCLRRSCLAQTPSRPRGGRAWERGARTRGAANVRAALATAGITEGDLRPGRNGGIVHALRRDRRPRRSPARRGRVRRRVSASDSGDPLRLRIRVPIWLSNVRKCMSCGGPASPAPRASPRSSSCSSPRWPWPPAAAGTTRRTSQDLLDKGVQLGDHERRPEGRGVDPAEG